MGDFGSIHGDSGSRDTRQRSFRQFSILGMGEVPAGGWVSSPRTCHSLFGNKSGKSRENDSRRCGSFHRHFARARLSLSVTTALCRLLLRAVWLFKLCLLVKHRPSSHSDDIPRRSEAHVRLGRHTYNRLHRTNWNRLCPGAWYIALYQRLLFCSSNPTSHQSS